MADTIFTECHYCDVESDCIIDEDGYYCCEECFERNNEPECTCYEPEYGHQPGCPFYKPKSRR